MNRQDKAIAYLQENGCGTSAELAEAMGCSLHEATKSLCKMRRGGQVQIAAKAKANGKSGRPMSTWGLTRKKLEELVSGVPSGKVTIGHRILQWLMEGNIGTSPEVAEAVGLSSKCASEALTRLGKAGLAKAVRKERKAGMKGACHMVWAWTGSDAEIPLRRRPLPKLVRDEEGDDDLRPLNATPPEVIVRKAIESRSVLELVWGAA